MQVKSPLTRLLAWSLNGLLFVGTLPFRRWANRRPAPAGSPTSFLLVRLDHLGDVILSTPLYHSLKEKYPRARLTVLCGSWARDLLVDNPYVDEVMVLDCPWWTAIRTDAPANRQFWRGLWSFIRQLRQRRFDVFIDLRGDLRHIFLFGWLARIPMRIAYTRSGGKFLLTHPFAYPPQAHEMARSYQLLAPFVPIHPYWQTEIYPRATTFATLQAALGNRLELARDGFVVFFNGGRSRLRRIDDQKVGELAKQLIENYGLTCCYVGSSLDRPGGEVAGTVAVSSRFLNLCGELSLVQLRELISHAQVFFGTDSSVSHLSASTTTPSVVLYGPLNPEETMPLGENKRVIYHRYPCSPCRQTTCVVTQSPDAAQCMGDITVEELLNQARQYLTQPA